MTPDEKVKRIEEQRNTRLLQATMAVVSLIVLISATIGFVIYNQRQADKRWCSLMVSLDDRYQAIPAKDINADAKAFADKIHVLRSKFHCKPSDVLVPLSPAAPQTTASSLPESIASPTTSS